MELGTRHGPGAALLCLCTSPCLSFVYAASHCAQACMRPEVGCIASNKQVLEVLKDAYACPGICGERALTPSLLGEKHSQSHAHNLPRECSTTRCSFFSRIYQFSAHNGEAHSHSQYSSNQSICSYSLDALPTIVAPRTLHVGDASLLALSLFSA